MYASLLCLSLAASPMPAADDTRTSDAAQASLDGSWTAICLEKNGQPVPDAKGKTVNVKDNTFTCTGKDGKQGMTFKVDFAKKGMIEVTETAGDDGSKTSGTEKKKGVYVLTHDILAVCMHDEKNTEESTGTSSSPHSKSHCTIILKREGTGNK